MNSNVAAIRTLNALPVADAQRAEMRAREPELDQHGLVSMGDGDDLIALVGEGRARGSEVGSDGLFAIEDNPGTIKLVPGMFERCDRLVPFMGDLQRHVALHGFDAAGAKVGGHG